MEKKIKKSSRQKAYEVIKDKIIFFEWKPGQKKLESQLAREIGLGRTPVREAIVKIEGENLIKHHDGFGYSPTILEESEMNDYFLLRLALEKIAVQLIMERITPADIEKLKVNLKKSEPLYREYSLRSVIECDNEFHHILYESGRSELLKRAMLSLQDKTIFLRAMATHTPTARSNSLSDHKLMVAAIEEKNSRKLLEIIAKHINRAKESYRSMKQFFT